MKDLIERLRKVATLCGDYPKFSASKTITQEAADAIETLQAELAQTNTIADLEVKKLQAELEQTKRERDAAVADIPKRCCLCKHERHVVALVAGRADGVCKTCVENNRMNWTWRGPQDKQEDEL